MRVFLFCVAALAAGLCGTAANGSIILSQFGSVSNSNLTAINTLYTGNGDTVSTKTSAAVITAGDLAGVDLFIGWEPTNSYTASEIAALAGFLAGGGHILFQGEVTVHRLGNNDGGV